MAKSKFKAELLDELIKGQDPKTVLLSGGLFGELNKALAERILNAEMDYHLGQAAEEASGNHRNGSSSKTVLTGSEERGIEIPRDRQGHFEPGVIRKYQRRLPGFDEKVKGRDMNRVNEERRGSVIVLQGAINAEVNCSGCLELAVLMSEGKARQRTVHGKPCEGKLHARFDEGIPETG